jgi:phosphatidate cytidylyltransferase
VSDATERPAVDATAAAVTGGWAQGLRTRTIFGALMAAIALAAVFLGDVVFGALIGAGAVILGWEWVRLCGEGRFGRTGIVVAGTLAAICVLAFLDHVALALSGSLVGAVAVFVVARLGARTRPLWAAAGMIYIGIPVVALIWLRGHEWSGERLILWLMLSVAATDIGAFFAGRLIGGPRLAPRISPKKTWAGLGGAMVASALVGAAFGWLDGQAPPARILAVAGVVLAVVAQIGDLGESWVKRRFGAKDSSQLIPGHGGLLDRVDGLIVAAAVLALFQWISAGSLLTWR